FIRSETLPFLPRAATRTVSSASRSVADWITFSNSVSRWFKSVMVSPCLLAISCGYHAVKLRRGHPVCGQGPSFALYRIPGRRRLGGVGCESCLRLIDESLERCRFTYCEIGENLAVQFDLGLLQTVHKSGIGQAILARTGVDALNPQ